MRTSVVIVAAGMGRRMNAETTKQLIHIGGKPILWHTLKGFQEMAFIDEIVLVVKEDERIFIETELCGEFPKIAQVVSGGKERSDSVRKGLAAVGSSEVVLIHDGARPFVTAGAVKRLLDGMRNHEAAILALPVKDTIKEVDKEGRVVRTFDRSKLWAVQTPQAFKRDIIEEAYNKYDQITSMIYDDAMLVETAVMKSVIVVEGDDSNIKITTPFDLVVGEAIYRSR